MSAIISAASSCYASVHYILLDDVGLWSVN